MDKARAVVALCVVAVLTSACHKIPRGSVAYGPHGRITLSPSFYIPAPVDTFTTAPTPACGPHPKLSVSGEGGAGQMFFSPGFDDGRNCRVDGAHVTIAIESNGRVLSEIKHNPFTVTVNPNDSEVAWSNWCGSFYSYEVVARWGTMLATMRGSATPACISPKSASYLSAVG